MKISFLLLILFFSCSVNAQIKPKLVTVAGGWAANTVNTAVFRKNSLVTFAGWQYTAFYDQDGFLVLAKRPSGLDAWEVSKTRYKGNARDAHNIISIMADGDGFLHVAWDHHNNALRYARSLRPGSLELSEKMEMTGQDENQLSYPEFYKLKDGSLLFFYRDGGSGSGNLVINKYDLITRKWTRLHSNLIDGEGKRNAYWQACVDENNTIHIYWVWRESPDVSSNHDMCYARSKDGGLSWETSGGKKYVLPVTAESAEYALRIPQKSELINQTSMSCDKQGNPFIVSYWKDSLSLFPQYHLLYNTGGSWRYKTLDFRKTGFSLSGMGTKKIPISRPQVLVKGQGRSASVLVLFRDEDRGSKASALKIGRLKKLKWSITDLNDSSLGSWEPTYDTELWREKKILNLFIQNTEQKDGEGMTNNLSQPVQVLQWKPQF